MVLALQLVAASWSGREDVTKDLANLPEHLSSQFEYFDTFAREYGDTSRYALTVFLGLGGYEGLAHEATLKLKEMTQQPCEAYNPLEFRHGPISIVDDQSLVVMIEGLRERDYIIDVERDIRSYGADVTRIAPYESTAIASGLIIGPDVSDVARSCLYLPALQLLAYYRASSSGLDPDKPRNLSQVVVLHER
jgi:glucosamine--fructose-6-phosphate aminotransferase (isomerizing)